MPDQSETMSKTEKKSEVLEVRLPHETKKAFMEACKEKGETASGVLRTAIDGFLVARTVGPIRSKLRDTVFVLAGAAIGAFGFSAVYAPKMDINPLAQQYFTKVDENGDQRVSREEFVNAIVSRGTTTRDDPKPDETILRTTGVALIIPQTLSAELKNTGQLEGCFKTLAEMGDTERAREFYSLDTDDDNQLSYSEFADSTRIPSIAALKNAFRKKDVDEDRLLDRKEAAENIETWMEANATLQNERTSSKYLGVPQNCTAGNLQAGVGKLYIKFEQLKRRIDFFSSEAVWLVDGMTDERFAGLDRNKDTRLSFSEFIRWYL